MTKDGTNTIRMFPDYADTVLWFVDGPVPYPDTGLVSGLIADLQEWEELYYRSLTPDFGFKSPAHAAAFSDGGRALAARVAEELGDGFVIELHLYDDDGPYRVTGTGPPRNPEAVAAFHRIQELAAAERALFSSGQGQYEASAPLLGDTFRPTRPPTD